jgi:hypothetical protein
MALPFDLAADASSSPELGSANAARDPRARQILAKSIYRELRQGGLAEEDVMAIASDLLGLVAHEVKDRRARR